VLPLPAVENLTSETADRTKQSVMLTDTACTLRRAIQYRASTSLLLVSEQSVKRTCSGYTHVNGCTSLTALSNTVVR
jgi:hypothetical protein